jgi:hypothetical protein
LNPRRFKRYELAANRQKRSFFMKWTTLNLGKHAGLSLPQIILTDADWFFWAFNNGVFWGNVATEAEDPAAKAKAIKIPERTVLLRMERSRRPRRRNRLWIARLNIWAARSDAGGCPVALW